eukprot:jgi/Ulvmu1/8918/UM005_0009.1
MADSVMSILHMGEKQAIGGSLWSSATPTTTKRRAADTPFPKQSMLQKHVARQPDLASDAEVGTCHRGFKPKPAQAPITKRNLDHMPSVLMQAALQAAMAWESGQQLYQQGHSEEAVESMPTDSKPAGDAIKRLIASNLETVHWAQLQAQTSAAESVSNASDDPATEAEDRRLGGVLAGTLLEAAGKVRGSKRGGTTTRLRRMLQMLKTWPESGISISVDALPSEVADVVTGKAASAAAYIGMDGINVSAVGVGTAAVTEEGVSQAALTDALCAQVGYPFDLVVPGMLTHNMLEFTVNMATGEVRLKLMKNWRRADHLADDDPGRGMSQDFVKMLLRAYDSFGRDVCSSDGGSSGSSSVYSSNGFEGGCRWSASLDAPSPTSMMHHSQGLHKQSASPHGSTGGQSHSVAARGGRRRQDGAQLGHLGGSAGSGTVHQERGEDGVLVDWAVAQMGTGAGGLEVDGPRRSKRAQRGVRRSVVDASGCGAAVHRGPGAHLHRVDIKGMDGMPLPVNLSTARDLLQLPPWDSGLAACRGLHVYIVPDNAGRLLRVVDGGPARGLLQVAVVTDLVEDAVLTQQGVRARPVVARPQLLFTQHLSTTEQALAQDAVHRFVRSMGLQTVQDLLSGIKVMREVPPGAEGGLELGPLSEEAQRAVRSSAVKGGAWGGSAGLGGPGSDGRMGRRGPGRQRGMDGRQEWGADGMVDGGGEALRSVGAVGGVAVAALRLRRAGLRAAEPDGWRVPGAADDIYITPGGLEGPPGVAGDVQRDLDAGGRRFHVPAVPGELSQSRLGGSGGSHEGYMSLATRMAAGGGWRFSAVGAAQFSRPSLLSRNITVRTARDSKLAPWKAGQPAPHAGGAEDIDLPMYMPTEPARASSGRAWRPSGFAHGSTTAPSALPNGLSKEDVERIKAFGWNRFVEWQQLHAEAARARIARRQQLAQERAAPPQPHAAPAVDLDDVARHMEALMQLYRSDALDAVRSGGGERQLWEAAARYLEHASHRDPWTGETLLRVADSRTAQGKHLLQALHVATEARTWRAHEMPAVGLPVPVGPAADFRSLGGSAGRAVRRKGATRRPEFLVGGHEAVEELAAQPHCAGKIVVAAPDVASHVVYTRTAESDRQRSSPPALVSHRQPHRGSPVCRLRTAATAPVAVLEAHTVEGNMVGRGRTADPNRDQATTAPNTEAQEDALLASGIQRVTIHAEVSRDLPEEESEVSLFGKHDVRCRGASSGGVLVPACKTGRHRRVRPPPVLRVGVIDEVQRPPQQPSGSSWANFVQGALQGKAADRILMLAFDAKSQQ